MIDLPKHVETEILALRQKLDRANAEAAEWQAVAEHALRELALEEPAVDVIADGQR